MGWWSIPYGEPVDLGYWGQQTSTIDWCEENYVVSPYVAEAVNTVTNAGFICLALFALVNVIQQKLEKRFLLVSLGFTLVGIGSWLFHMTLRYEFQLLDELPMIYATCVPYWIVFSFGKTQRESIRVGTEITVAAAVLTAVYLHYRNPTIHQAGYAVLNVIIIMKSTLLTLKHVKSDEAKKELWKTMSAGVGTFLLGYALWNIDIHLCSTWITTRRQVGMPLGFLLEGHGWWHLFTGTGVYYYVVYLEYLRIFLLGTDGDYQFEWVAFGLLPRVTLTKTARLRLEKEKTK